MHLRLKTKLVMAITAMVVALVTVLSYVYVSQLVRERINDAGKNGEIVAHQILNAAREALELDFSDTRIDQDNPDEVRQAIEDSLQSDPGLNNQLQSIIGLQFEIYDVAIVDTRGIAILHTEALLQNKLMAPRPNFEVVRRMDVWHQIKMLYGPQQVFDVTIPVARGGKPFGQIRVGIQTIFLQHDLKPQLNRAFEFAGLSIFVSFLLAALLSNLALRPLAVISRRLDQLSEGKVEPVPEPVGTQDEVGVVTTKINRLGQRMRDVQEVFSALKENLDQIMGNLQDGLMLFTHDERIVLVSASAERFVGRNRGDILGKTVREVFTPDTRLGRVVLDAFELHQEIAAREVEADSRRVQISLDFIEEERGHGIGALLTMRDAESVRRIEDEIELSRRLSAIGRLTSGVAHEVRNPINAIMVHLQILREKIQQVDPESRRHMDVIGTEIQRLGRVVQTLLDFTKPVELRLVDIDLRRLAEDVVNLAAPEAARHGVTMRIELPNRPLPVKVDADLVKQALLNIANNGIQAMPKGGTLTISGHRDDGTVQIDIADQGGGIPPELVEKVFNLYFTTKKAGTGIGLAMSYRVMQLHNGDITFDSQSGVGTAFHLRFPVMEPTPAVAGAEGESIRA